MRTLTLADLSGKRRNRALGGVTAREKAEIEHGNQLPKRQIPPSLDVRAFDGRVGLTKDDEGDPTFQRARRTYETFGKRLANFYERESVIRANEFETLPKRRMLVSKMIKDELHRGSEQVHAAREACINGVETIDKTINKSFRQRVPSDESREIREYLRGLGKADRRKFLGKADEETLAAILGAKPFLSGLGDAEHAALRYQAEQRLFPNECRRREKLKKAADQIYAGYDLLIESASALMDPGLTKFEQQQAAMKKAMAGGAE